uniref:Uncharacterized protein n=1 Tax=Marmota marmota marmota TaxID=9994 RepID=A0A8C5ZTD5_MARMA
ILSQRKLEPTILLAAAEGHKNVEAMQSYRPELSHLLEEQQEVQRQKVRLPNCGASPQRPHTDSWIAYQKCLYWLMCLVYLLSWMIQFLTY